jgi:hypothetical protein
MSMNVGATTAADAFVYPAIDTVLVTPGSQLEHRPPGMPLVINP